jgi:hypothetical protein
VELDVGGATAVGDDSFSAELDVGGATAVGDDSLSARIMSLQTCMHSSQMKAVGPAISFRTLAWALLQNEQRRAGSSRVLIRVLIISLLSPGLLCSQCEAQICWILGESS